MAQIAGALIAPGTIVVNSNVKKVQHPTGGVVGEVRVHDGDHVEAGDLLVRLDDTVTRSNLAIVTKGLTEFQARKAEFSAERDRADAIVFPDDLLERVDDPDVAQVLAAERKLFNWQLSARARRRPLASELSSSERKPVALRPNKSRKKKKLVS